MSPISKIKKRNLEIEDFQKNKILLSLEKAASLHKENNNFSAAQITEKIIAYLQIFIPLQSLHKEILSTEQLRLLIINILEEQGYKKIAHSYTSYIKNTEEEKNNNAAHFSEEALKFISQNYLKNIDKKNIVQSLEEFFEKIAAKVSNQKDREFIKECLEKKYFIPHDNFLRGNCELETLNLQLEDNLESIFENLKKCSLAYQKGINTHIDFSKLRPKNTQISSNNQVSSGPVSFIKIFIASLEALREGGTSNTTQTFTLNIHHPDIVEFILYTKKVIPHKNFHFIIELNENYREALEQKNEYELINPQNGKAINSLNAENIFDFIISALRENNNLSLKTPKSLKSHSQPIRGIISGYINLSSLITDNEFDFKLFQKVIVKATHYLKELAKKEANEKEHLHILYLTGYAEMLIHLGINYHSLQSLQLTEKILQATKAYGEKNIHFGIKNDPYTSLIWDISSGIEPLSQLGFLKKDLEGNENYYLHPLIQKTLLKKNAYDKENIKYIITVNSVENIPQLPKKIQQLFQVGKEISPQWQIKIQSLFEEYFDQEIEKKIYLNHETSIEELKELFLLALKSGCHMIGKLEMKKIEDLAEQSLAINEKKFLLNLSQMKKNSKKIQLQPQLFPLKKTEEISLPPINSSLT